MEFHLIVNGKQEGPFSIEELSQKGITPESEVWAEGMADWQQAGDVPELTAVLQRAEFEAAQHAARVAENQATTGQPYAPPVTPSQAPPRVPPYTPVQEQPREKSGCTPWLIAGLILAIVFATMVFTCPKRSAHEEAIQEVTKAWVGDKVDQQMGGMSNMGGIGDIINKIVKQITGAGTDMAISNYLDVKNYVVCSVGRISVGDTKDKMVSLGVFGHVFTFDKEDLERLWAQAMDEYESRNGSGITPPATPQQQDDQSEPSEDEDNTVDPMALPDSIMGIEVPEGMDTMFNQMANEAIRMAKEWAKQQIDNIGR